MRNVVALGLVLSILFGLSLAAMASDQYMGMVKAVIFDHTQIQEEIRIREIPPKVLILSDESLPEGMTRVVQDGREGLIREVYQLTYINDQADSRKLLERYLVQEPQDRIISRGTGRRDTPVARDSLQVGDRWQGRASWYGGKGSFFQGRKTASGEIFDSEALTAAHPFLPFGTRVMVTNIKSGRQVEVRINDRGPFIRGRIIDVSKASAKTLGIITEGVAEVRVEIMALPEK